MDTEKKLLTNGLWLLIAVILLCLGGCGAVEEAVHDPEFPAFTGAKPGPAVDEPGPATGITVADSLPGEILLALPAHAFNFRASPDGNYLFFHRPSAPFQSYQLVSTVHLQGGIPSDPEVAAGQILELPTPSVSGWTERLEFSRDGKKLLYLTSEFQPGDNEVEPRTVIHLARPGLPPEPYHQVELAGKEVTLDTGAVWAYNCEAFYYVTAAGIFHYCLQAWETTLLIPSSDLPGLARDGHLAPHAFNVNAGRAELAYFHQGLVRLVHLGNSGEWVEVFDTGIESVVSLEFIFDGRYICLENAYIEMLESPEGYSAEFLNLQAGQLVAPNPGCLPAGHAVNDRGETVFLQAGDKGELEYVLLDDSFGVTGRAKVPASPGWADVVYLGGRFCLPLYPNPESTLLVELVFQ